MEQLAFSTFETPPQPAARTAFDQRMMPVYAALGIAWAVLIVAMPLTGLSIDAVLVGAFLAVCGLCSWGAVCLRLRGWVRIATAIESWALLNVACLTGILATCVAARSNAPFLDSWMDTADRFILPGLNWRDTVLAIGRHTALMHHATQVYASLQWQGSLLILLCCATGRIERCPRFILSWTIALGLISAVFVFTPCVGAFAYYGIGHDVVPSVGASRGWSDLLMALRTHDTMRLDPSALDGIVEFPSFHTAGAILLAWGFWAIRWARWPMLALNLAMIAATVPIGGHYYSDVVAGAVVAWLAIKAPDWIVSLRAR